MTSDLMTYVQRYSEQGWALVPNRVSTKQPLISKWQITGADPHSAHALFAGHPNSNIGVVLGTASGGVVDVDLDAREAAFIADHLLPTTGLRFGRRSKPNSHRFYRVPNPGRREAFVHPGTGAMLIELRGNGHQTIVPPSIHESHEFVSFGEGGEHGEPATSDWNELKRCCALIATALVFLDHWQHGQRHSAALSLSGLLAQCGATETEAKRVVTALMIATGDEEAADRLACVRTTYQRAHSQQRVSTFGS